MRTLTQGHTKKMSKIQLITFDLDDTFWDIRSTIINAEINSRKWSEDRIGEEIEWGTFEDFMKIRDELIKKYHPYTDGKSSQRMIKAVRKYISNSGVPRVRKLSFLRRLKVYKIFGF